MSSKKGLGSEPTPDPPPGELDFYSRGVAGTELVHSSLPALLPVAHTAETRGRRGAPGCGRVVGRRVEDGCFRPRLPAAPRLLLRFFFMNPLPFPQRGQVQPADWPGLSRELTGPVAKRSVHLLPRVRLLCGAGPGPRVLIKSQPGLPVHPGKCRCVCAS